MDVAATWQTLTFEVYTLVGAAFGRLLGVDVDGRVACVVSVGAENCSALVSAAWTASWRWVIVTYIDVVVNCDDDIVDCAMNALGNRW